MKGSRASEWIPGEVIVGDEHAKSGAGTRHTVDESHDFFDFILVVCFFFAF